MQLTIKAQAVIFLIIAIVLVGIAAVDYSLTKRVHKLEVNASTTQVVVIPTVEPTASPSATIAPTVAVKKTFVPVKTVAPVK